jgi:hypothetical protein
MEFQPYERLTEIEKKQVDKYFNGWKLSYVHSLKFKKNGNDWYGRDDSLLATVCMRKRTI